MAKVNKTAVAILKQVADELGWNFNQEHDYAELNKYTNAGEDYSFFVDALSSPQAMAKQIDEFVFYFDPEEHAEKWVIARHESGPNKPKREIPRLRILLDDADYIADELDKLNDLIQDRVADLD